MMVPSRWLQSKEQLRQLSLQWKNTKKHGWARLRHLVSHLSSETWLLKQWKLSMLCRIGLRRWWCHLDGFDPKISWDVWVCSGKTPKSVAELVSGTQWIICHLKHDFWSNESCPCFVELNCGDDGTT
jgi:hypothetical protein